MKRTAPTRQPNAEPGPNRIHRLMDEVYREMFLLESRRPGAEMGLAMALLRARVAADLPSECGMDWAWLKTVWPICLKMIQDSLDRRAAAASLSQMSCDPNPKS